MAAGVGEGAVQQSKFPGSSSPHIVLHKPTSHE